MSGRGRGIGNRHNHGGISGKGGNMSSSGQQKAQKNSELMKSAYEFPTAAAMVSKGLTNHQVWSVASGNCVHFHP
jgi:hypothetical protein